MKDDEIIMNLFAYAYYKVSPDYAGDDESLDESLLESWQNRWESQARLAVDILNGKVLAEDFVRNGATGKLSEYANGANSDYLNAAVTRVKRMRGE